MAGDSENEAIERPDGAPDKLDPELVADWLKSHPDFLSDRPDVLESIVAPSNFNGDGVIDMQKFILERLRGEIDNLRNCAIDLIETSRINMSNQTRTNTAVLALLGAADFEHGMRIIVEDLPLFLDIDIAAVGFEPSPTPLPGLASPAIQRLQEGTVDSLLSASKDVALISGMNDDGTFFGAGSGLVRSAAFARLREGNGLAEGLLCLGSRREGAFHPGQGTEVLTFLARVAERCLHGWLASPA